MLKIGEKFILRAICEHDIFQRFNSKLKGKTFTVIKENLYRWKDTKTFYGWAVTDDGEIYCFHSIQIKRIK